eukprot:1160714-Pelagomonas_calceolata.AAC.13
MGNIYPTSFCQIYPQVCSSNIPDTIAKNCVDWWSGWVRVGKNVWGGMWTSEPLSLFSLKERLLLACHFLFALNHLLYHNTPNFKIWGQISEVLSGFKPNFDQAWIGTTSWTRKLPGKEI